MCSTRPLQDANQSRVNKTISRRTENRSPQVMYHRQPPATSVALDSTFSSSLREVSPFALYTFLKPSSPSTSARRPSQLHSSAVTGPGQWQTWAEACSTVLQLTLLQYWGCCISPHVPNAASKYCRGCGKESLSWNTYQLLLPLHRLPSKQMSLLGSKFWSRENWEVYTWLIKHCSTKCVNFDQS